MVERCTATAKSGRPCTAQAYRDGLCRWHHPDLEAERAAWRRKGGAGRATAQRAAKRLPSTLQDVQALLLGAMRGVEAGALEPSRAQALAALARAVVVVHEHGALEARLAALEAAAGLAGAERGVGA
jgi:hypothetical protein